MGPFATSELVKFTGACPWTHAPLPSESQSCTPCCEGTRPVRMEARDAEHTGVFATASVNVVPSAASAESVGVRISSLP